MPSALQVVARHRLSSHRALSHQLLSHRSFIVRSARSCPHVQKFDCQTLRAPGQRRQEQGRLEEGGRAVEVGRGEGVQVQPQRQRLVDWALEKGHIQGQGGHGSSDHMAKPTTRTTHVDSSAVRLRRAALVSTKCVALAVDLAR